MKTLHHDSAIKHVTGQSIYVDDIEAGKQLLYGKVVFSRYAKAKILSVNTVEASKLPGVRSILTHKDIPGENQMGPVIHDETCLAVDEVDFVGQAIALIAAESQEIAREAEKLIKIEYEPLEPVLTIAKAIEKNNLLQPPRKIETGNPVKVLKNCENYLEGTLTTGGQEHWYLETQSALAVPGEEQEMKIYSSTQHPSETQAIISEVLGINRNEVEVEVRRMGGAFGGKETQANHYAAWAALLANATGNPVKIRLTRDEDQVMTGKRHEFFSNYKVGFDNEGKVVALDVEFNVNAGAAADLTMPILERAMFHIDNAYFIPNLRVIGKTWKTNIPPNTAFRGFGGPQGMAVIENIIDRIARYLKKDALEVRHLNFYKPDFNNRTHYGQVVPNDRLEVLMEQIITSSEYFNRRKNIQEFNNNNDYVKKGLALTPVKFGISFTTAFLNQAGALVNIYQDGTALVNHGGTEMGQGLNTKITEIAASELGISAQYIKVNSTNTSKVPNTSATAASSGTDLNGMAVKDAVIKIKSRLKVIAAGHFNKDKKLITTSPENVLFENDMVFDIENPERKIPFKELIPLAYLSRVSLSATGYYKTPNIHFDRDTGKGKPFHYFASGMSVSEVILDTLTGKIKLLRTDILHDAGKSVNERIDIGQIEGGFIQGLGWVTNEELKHDKNGNLLTHSPDTYKIPTISDIPKDFRVELLKGYPNPNTIRQSKAIGEPPFMHALSVWMAIKDAVSSVGNHEIEPYLPIPATSENILKAISEIKRKVQK